MKSGTLKLRQQQQHPRAAAVARYFELGEGLLLGYLSERKRDKGVKNVIRLGTSRC
jgi:hypothetical protein